MVSLPTPTQRISHPLLSEKQIQLFVKRDDLIHGEIMGNKWRKLRYNLEEMKRNSIDSLITMGGAFSNHIAATAAAAKEHNLKAIGIIRGEELNEVSNPTLQFAHAKGMELHFVDRAKFRNLRDNAGQIEKFYPNHFFLPEGGTNELAVKGCEEIIPEISIPFDVIVTPIGTGGTFAGLTKSALKKQQIMGISSLKGDFIFNEISELLKELNIRNKNYSIINDYHFGGYGKVNGELIDFINWFKENFNIPLDPIYTGKSFFGVWDMIKTDKFEKNLKIVLLHTGGLQGIKGFNRKNENIIQ
ncbi:1-aminocyclopropane-1-carboxylate deaminase/D-cysteine desulfhydrase [Ekhidna sp.]|uniref:1-aminocyclopropane-1-carboxylate deaminase/D-cysteine desulfhydrase n=1 Tax=Ekhidna sp. TaxID=2608089 RepID=UPI003C7C7A9E